MTDAAGFYHEDDSPLEDAPDSDDHGDEPVLDEEDEIDGIEDPDGTEYRENDP